MYGEEVAPFFLSARGGHPLPACAALSAAFPALVQTFHDALLEPLIMARPSAAAAPLVAHLKAITTAVPAAAALGIGLLDLAIAATFTLYALAWPLALVALLALGRRTSAKRA